jgi:hypothetical protein
VLTRDFDEFAAAREDLLLGIMNFVEDSGTSLAMPTQTLYLRGDPRPGTDKIKAALKKAPSSQSSPDHAQPAPAAHNHNSDEENSGRKVD